MTKEDRDKELKDIATRRIQLGQLAGQLGGFVGESESVKKAVVKAIIAKINTTEELKNEYSPLVTNLSESVNSADQAGGTDVIGQLKDKVTSEIAETERLIESLKTPKNLSLPSPSDSADSDKLSSKLEALKKVEELCGFLSNSKSQQNDPKNLLDNLCIGLEKFLGFNPSSKGYDGTGIVYSDLDRLSDGVMGFLSGVLSNIKGHLGQHKNTLDSAISILNTNKHGGKIGFNSAIVKVVEGVRGYNGLVERSNNAVKSQIQKMQKRVNNDFKAAIANIPDRKQLENMPALQVESKVKEAEKLAGKYVQYGKDFESDMSGVTEQIKELNNDLKTEIKNVRKNIQHEGMRLDELSANEKKALEATEDKIKTTLHEIKCNVSKHIKKRVKQLMEKLKEKLREIQTKLVDINLDLIKHLQKLEKWMKDVEKFVEEARKRSEKIMNEVMWDDTNTKNAKRNKIDNAATNLRKRADELFKAGELAKQKVQETVTKALEQVIKMNDALKTDLFTVKGQIKKAVMELGETLVGNVKKDLTALKGKITQPLGDIVGTADEFSEKFEATKIAINTATAKVETYLENLKNLHNFEEIDSGITPSLQLLQGLKEDNAFIQLKTYIGQLDEMVMQNVKKVMDHEAWIDIIGYSGPSHLNKIFKNNERMLLDPLDALQRVIEGSVPDIEPINAQLKQYLGREYKDINKLSLPISRSSRAIENVVSAVRNGQHQSLTKEHVNSLLKDIGTVAQAVSSHSTTVVEEFMKAIQKEFITEIEKVTQVIKNKVTKIKSGIAKSDRDQKIVYYDGGAEDSRGLQALVTQFDTKIKQELRNLKNTIISDEIFKTNSGGADDYNLDHVMSNFHSTYEKNFTDGNFKTSGGTSERNVLDEEIGPNNLSNVGSSANKISSIAASNFTSYEQQVKQDTVATSQGNIENLNGELPSKIKDIKQQVADIALKSISDLNEQAEKQFKEVISNLDALCTAVKREAEIVEGNLQVLKNTQININLKDIHGLIEKLRKTDLNKVIDLTHNFITFYADKAGEQIIKGLEQDANLELEDAQKALITHARKQYISAIGSLLHAFVTKVDTELLPLPNLIKADLEVGFNGYMKKMETHLLGDDKAVAAIKAIKNTFSSIEKSPLSQAAGKFFGGFRRYCHYLKGQADFRSDFHKLEASHDAVNNLLRHLESCGHFDHEFDTNLCTLRETLTDLHPSQFGTSSTHMLQALKEGIGALVTEFDKAYVSSYSGVKYEGPLVTEETIDTKTIELTAYGTKLSKVCLTITPILFGTLDELKNALENKENSWNTYTVYNSTRPTKGLCHLFFRDHGYDSGCESTVQYGELNHKSEFTGRNIYKHLTEGARKLFESSDNLQIVATLRDGSHAIPVEYSTGEGLIPELSGYHKLYAQVSHLIFHPKRRSPCNVYEMLLWCTGLQFNSVYNKLHEHCDSLFAKRKDERMPDVEISLPIDAHPKPIYATDIGRAIEHITSHAYMLLTGILGTGDAATYYACDFPINTLNLTYPTSGGDCLQMLLDVLRTLCPALKYLRMQCKLGPSDCGWARCLYGKSVSPANWQCKEHSNNKAACQPNCQVNDQPTCQPRSPLMSYLNDCLPGHLPHRLISVGCKSECRTCPSGRPGMPCLTPLGFRAFSGSTKTGSDLCEIIEMFFGDDLVSSLFCLGTKPPASLPEHVSFALSLVSGWRNVKKHSLKIALESHVNEVSINLCDKPYVVTSALGNAYGCSVSDHGSFHPKEDSADLASLSMRMTCATQQCGPYLYSLSSDMYKYMANKNANLFLSWCLYLPWQLLQCLQNLCDEFNDIFCQDWGCDRCLRDDKCKRGKHGVSDAETKKPNCDCTSVVNCRGVSPTLYRYGFAFGNAFTLNNRGTKKTCSDFHTQLQNVLKSKYFEQLFTTVDHFMFTIRFPFMTLTLALWLLSFLYLLHIMVIRLDLLHIKSHLHSPSSHRIAAQSLLAAARVNKLNRVFYLQP